MTWFCHSYYDASLTPLLSQLLGAGELTLQTDFCSSIMKQSSNEHNPQLPRYLPSSFWGSLPCTSYLHWFNDCIRCMKSRGFPTTGSSYSHAVSILLTCVPESWSFWVKITCEYFLSHLSHAERETLSPQPSRPWPFLPGHAREQALSDVSGGQSPRWTHTRGEGRDF